MRNKRIPDAPKTLTDYLKDYQKLREELNKYVEWKDTEKNILHEFFKKEAKERGIR